jgi:nucleoside-diphosphate-sugar epimerase
LKILVDRSTTREIEIQEQMARIRPNDIPVMLCDPTKLEKGFGWKPTISIEQTLQDLLDYWREKVEGGES